MGHGTCMLPLTMVEITIIECMSLSLNAVQLGRSNLKEG